MYYPPGKGFVWVPSQTLWLKFAIHQRVMKFQIVAVFVMSMTYSEDGLWFWNGDDWIPAPPKSPPPNVRRKGPPPKRFNPNDKSTWHQKQMPITESHVQNKPPIVAMQDSVIGGDVNYNPQVIHNTQNIINNNSQGDINNPVEDFSEVSKNAYESGRKALQALGIFVLILVLNGLIGLAFEAPEPQNNNQNIYDNQIDSDESFNRVDYYSVSIIVMIVFWLITGLYIFAMGGPVNTFNRVREHYPASPVLELGDKGKNFHDVAKYSWLLPLVIFIIIIIVGLIIMKITAEMEKNKRR